MKIPITKPYFDECEKNKILEPLETGWLVQGPNVERFQTMFAEFTHSKYAIATSSCTSALHLGLVALGIKHGDSVIVPSFTYIASANAIEYTGAKPIFCDINPFTFSIDEIELEVIIEKNKNVKAIMPVNLFGLCANLPKIIEIAKKYNLKVIEDSACGFDAWIQDKHSGTFGDVGCFSFHPRKSITTAEGGMLITDNPDIANMVRILRDHGASKSDAQRHLEKGGSLLPEFNILGFNYRMTDLQGVLGVCQMEKAQLIMDKKRRIARTYDEALNSVSVSGECEGLSEYLIPPCVPEGYKHGYQSYVCLFTGGEDVSKIFGVGVGGECENLSYTHTHTDNSNLKKIIDKINVKRNEFMRKLEEKGIATRQGTHAVHTLGYYKRKYNLKDEDFIMSYAADRLSVALPLYVGMSDEEFEYVIKNIRDVLKVCV